MKSSVWLTIGLLLSSQVWAADVDLRQVMRQMRAEFSQAASAQTVQEMQVPVTKLTELVNKAQQGQYPPRRHDVYQEGFTKLIAVLDRLSHELDSGQLAQAKLTLREVDQLRMEYHRRR
ncbi:cytochrome b562 family protein [Vibrio sp. V31_P5A7T61]|nr:cytochrome b562 family protein [Vibrio sp. V31_P5A7T61]NAW77579.1 cytochrome b562 family protein [Vibrio sp. V33_P6A3T137]NAX00983.1 cytochrome b562 family protein [Vibrio sp. V34_P3A8T189]NAX08932.1 cytochrome b562 family protein [Vibrio sp. V40_P2S30T141]NAX62515.1 cytochrome b562 family protein [Vibrio sp. V32_P6A28T40]